MKEDSADIDLLLSFEEEEYEEEELSSARTTHGNDNADTADSCSLKPRKTKLGLSSFSHKSRGSCEGKRDKIRKTVNSLRGIVPGGNRMDTIAVFAEAVKYLKSGFACS
ncbi:putative transcription factor SAC51 [Helianthus annuus]|nr:putative transcription factor SAC51 [Helianthus annuus]